MAQLVMRKQEFIDSPQEYDVIAIHEDDVALTGIGYKDLYVMRIPVLTKKELLVLVNASIPAIRTTDTTIEVETTAGVWERIKYFPKYDVNMADISLLEWSSITSALTSKSTVESVIEDKCVSCIIDQLDELKPTVTIKTK